MWIALHRWKLYPREIEADLHVRGIDIGAWHRLERNAAGYPILSSRKLIVITDGFLPSEHSWFKLAAYRDHDKAKDKAERDAVKEPRQRLLSRLYAKVPKHKVPEYAKGGD